MKPKPIRTSVDLPASLHRRLREEAARRGCSARQLIVASIEQNIGSARRKNGRLSLERGLIRPTGKPISITNEEIYELGLP